MENWIASCEDMLRNNALSLTNLQNSERCRMKHERYFHGNVTEKMKSNVKNVQIEATRLKDGDFDELARNIEQRVRTAWEALSRHDRDRANLIASACTFYQTASEVCYFIFYQIK